MRVDNIPGKVVVLSLGSHGAEGKTVDVQTVQALADAGFNVTRCAKVLDVFAALSLKGSHIVIIDVIDSLDVDGIVLSSIIQSKFDAGIVLVVGSNSLERARGLNFGADICVSTPASFAEVAAAVASLRRRMPADSLPRRLDLTETVEDRPPKDCWQLEQSGWTLRAPNGRQISLTSTERTFLLIVFEDPERIIRREHWPRASAQNSDVLDLPPQRRMDALVSRLRRKAARIASPLPLHAFRRIGYQFSANCRVR